MLPRDLQTESFAGYPPEARRVASQYLPVLRQVPLSLLPSLLRELVDYDFKFPAERKEIDQELAALSALPSGQITEWLRDFASISVPKNLEQSDWINQPAAFLEQLSAYLWSTHQMDAFRKAALDYQARVQSARSAEPLPIPRLGIAVIGQGVTSYDAPLFRNLRAHGTYFSQVQPENGLNLLLKAAAARAQSHSAPYSHWYIDGGQEVPHTAELTSISYAGTAAVREALLRNMQTRISQPGMGPEELRSYLAHLAPSDLPGTQTSDSVLDRFRIKILTEGSGTQIFSTTFVQWATREALRRAQPLTVVARFAPRQRQRSMNELLSDQRSSPEVDPVGSLVDADMGAYYQWINQQRLPGHEASVFLVWFEGQSQALAIAPSLQRGAESKSPVNLEGLLNLALTRS